MEQEAIADAFSRINKVESVALSGSRTSAISDSDSDYDIYIYCTERIGTEERKRLYDSLHLDADISVSFFEEGDETYDGSNVFDIMFRSVVWTENEIQAVYREHTARLGYTTCILHNISTSRILFDRSGWFSKLQREISSGYPEKLRENIIRDNLQIIDGAFSAPFSKQLELAAKRYDIVSENHRLAALLASYFDIIFAYNRVYHPGEKKLMAYAHILCHELPEGFDDDINNAVKSIGQENLICNVRMLTSHLHAFLDRERG